RLGASGNGGRVRCCFLGSGLPHSVGPACGGGIAVRHPESLCGLAARRQCPRVEEEHLIAGESQLIDLMTGDENRPLLPTVGTQGGRQAPAHEWVERL